MREYYSLFVFRCYDKIIGLSFKKINGPRACGPQAYPSLARGYGQGLRLKRAGRTGPGPNINGLSRAWGGLDLKNFCGPGPGLDSNC